MALDVPAAAAARALAIHPRWLTVGARTRDLVNTHTLASCVQADLKTWPLSTLRSPTEPYGDMKAYGVGHELGHANLDAYLEAKTVWATLPQCSPHR